MILANLKKLAVGGGGLWTRDNPALVTSIDDGPVQWTFLPPGEARATPNRKEVLHKRHLGGQSYVVSDRNFGIDVTPDSVQVPGTGTWAGQSFWKNGLVLNPIWLDNVVDQGVEELLQYTLPPPTAQQSAKRDYDHNLNLHPSIRGPFQVTPGMEGTLFIGVRNPGLVNPDGTDWNHFSAYKALHILKEIPPEGSMPPGIGNSTKEIVYHKALMDKSALGSGFTLPPGNPPTGIAPLDTTIANYQYDSLQPFFEAWGENRRRWMLLFDYYATTGSPASYVNYSRDFGALYGDIVSGLLALGSSATDEQIGKVVAPGAQMMAMYDMGWRGANGAGQHNGYIGFLGLLGALFNKNVPGLEAKLLEIKTNATDNNGIVPPSFLDRSGSANANHNHILGPFPAEFIGRVAYMNNRNTNPPTYAGTLSDSNDDADYQSEGSTGDFANFVVVASTKNWRGGRDGLQVYARANSWNTMPWSGSGAAYMDHIFAISDTPGNIFSTNRNGFIPARHQALYRILRPGMSMGVYPQAPAAMTVFKNLTASLDNGYKIITPIDGGFTWDLSKIRGDMISMIGDGREGYPAIDARVKWSMDQGLTYQDCDTTGLTGTQTNLPKNFDIELIWQRACMINGQKVWGPWSVNYPRHVSPGADVARRGTFKTLGSQTGPAVNTTAAKIVVPIYPQWGWFLAKPAPAELDLTSTYEVKQGWGGWTGTIASPTYSFKRNGAEVGTAQLYQPIDADLVTDLSGVFTLNGVPSAPSTVHIPSAPVLPANYLLKNAGDASVRLFNPLVWASMLAGGSHVLAPVFNSAQYSKTVNEVTEILGQGFIVFGKNGQYPTVNWEMTADSLGLVAGEQYEICIDLGIGLTAAVSSGRWFNINLGNASGATNNYVEPNITAVDAPYVYHFKRTITALSGQTKLWANIGGNLPAGGGAGGNIEIGDFSIRHIVA